MRLKAIRWPSNTAVVISLLFSAAVLHGGPQHGLLLLSFCSLVVSLWLTTSIVKLDLGHATFVWGWVPSIALAYLGWLLVSPFVSTYPYASFSTAMQLALLPLTLLGWLLLPEKNKKKTWANTWWLLLICSIALAAWGVVDFSIARQRAHGPLIDANAYAALINLFLIPLTFNYLSPQPSGPGNRHLLVGLIALLALAQFMSVSRGGLIAFLVVLPVLLWQHRSSPKLRSRSLTLLLVFGSAYLVVKLFPVDPQRSVEALLLGSGFIEADTGTQARLLIWKSTWKIIQDANIFIGTGLGTFTNYYVAYRDPQEIFSAGYFAHNDYLQALQEGGLIQVAFFFGLTIFAPIALLYKSGRQSGDLDSLSTNNPSTGLLLGITCVAIHAAVNFIQFIAPIAILTGLYLARGWESLNVKRFSQSFDSGAPRYFIKPGFAKGLAIALLVIPVLLLTLDGVIFRIFNPKDSILSRLDTPLRFTLLNTALALRPTNPVPRVTFIQDLLSAAEQARSPAARDQLLTQAEREAEILSARAPALASGRYFKAIAMAMRGTPAQLALARDDLEYVVKHVPPATKMRLALIRIYRKLGQNAEAYRTVVEAKQWVVLERDKHSLTTFAKEAQIVALNHQDQDEADYWAWVQMQLTASGRTG